VAERNSRNETFDVCGAKQLIVGIGTDVVAISRMKKILERHGYRLMEKLLAASEHAAYFDSTDQPRFLAKRFAAKEALGKALGTGIRAPLLLPSISVVHDELGKPFIELHGDAVQMLKGRKLTSHLSISDERDYALAFVVLEQV
jgi:holo-[acyl-carrier protein] synthase